MCPSITRRLACSRLLIPVLRVLVRMGEMSAKDCFSCLTVIMGVSLVDGDVHGCAVPGLVQVAGQLLHQASRVNMGDEVQRTSIHRHRVDRVICEIRGALHTQLMSFHVRPVGETRGIEQDEQVRFVDSHYLYFLGSTWLCLRATGRSRNCWTWRSCW